MPRTRLFLIMSSAILIVAGLGWAFIESIKPLPGVEELQDGRNHLPQGTPIEYKYNPPTSGDHYPDPAKAGVYEQPIPDGNLVHSLEHGYIIMWYDCEIKTGFNLIPQALAHGTTEEHATESAKVTPTATLPESFSSSKCQDLVASLKQIHEEKGSWKTIVIPRFEMDSRIALSAWGRVEKFNPSTDSTSSLQAGSGLSDFDKARIENFIDKLRDHGPEKTEM